MSAIRHLLRLPYHVLRLAACTLVISIARLRARSNSDRDRYIGAQLTRTLEALGGIYVKFGQLLSTRLDWLSLEMIEALESLTDSVSPEPFERCAQTIQRELDNDSAAALLGAMEREPVAAASLATVFRARLDGRVVAVKVQRSEVMRTIALDLLVLKALARVIDVLSILGRFRVRRIVSDFTTWIYEELDFGLEARNIEFFRRAHRHDPAVVIPQVHWQYSAKRVLVMDFVEGTWVSVLRRTGESSPECAAVAFRAVMQELFEFGVFHADLHAGNLCIREDGKLQFIDFGMVGRINEQRRRKELAFFELVYRRELGAAFDLLGDILDITEDADLVTFRARFEANVQHWLMFQQQPAWRGKEKYLGWLILQNFAAARECGVSFHAVSSQFYRAIFVLEGVCARLDPDFELTNHLHRYLRERRRRELHHLPRQIADQYPEMAKEAILLLPRLIPFLEALTRFRPSQALFRWTRGISDVIQAVNRSLQIALAVWIVAFTGRRLLVASDVISLRGHGIALLDVSFQSFWTILLAALAAIAALSWLRNFIRNR